MPQGGIKGIKNTGYSGIWSAADSFYGYIFKGLVASGGSADTYDINGTQYVIHEFTTSDDFVVLSPGECDVLIVAGGGGGGGSPHGGGGGSGGLVFATLELGLGAYPVSVGSGGIGRTGSNGSPWPSAGTNKGTNGGDSSFNSFIAIGGGGGGGYSGGGANDTPGQPGGSGGGGTDESSGGSGLQPGSPSGGFGNAGAKSTNNTYAGGGGGAGGGARGTYLEDGGNGLNYSQFFGTTFGVNGFFAGGGGGSGYATSDRGEGGSGGGGQGGSNSVTAADGIDGTGGGGGGQERYFNAKGGDGGSGIVLIRYLA